MTYQFSRYLHSLERSGWVAVFHELHPDPLYFSEENWRKINQNPATADRESLRKLLAKGLIVESAPADDQECRSCVSRFESRPRNPFILYLTMAQGCNFVCRGCPVPSRPHQDRLLDLEDALLGIDLWLDHIRDIYDPNAEYWVIFHGGEPLLNKRLVEPLLEYLEEKAGFLGEGLKKMISTNGCFVDQELAELCRSHNVIVTVGIDGFEDANDAIRRDINGKGTFPEIVSAIDLLVSTGVETCASIALTPWNIDSAPQFLKFLQIRGVVKVGFNFLKGKHVNNLIGSADRLEFYRKAARCVIESSREMPDFEFQMQKKRSVLDSGRYYPHDCTCYGNQLVVQADGQITNCPFLRADLGHVIDLPAEFRIWDQPIVREWRKRLPLYSPVYEGFAARSFCGGGCAWSSSELGGSILAPDEAEMIFAEEVLDELIWSKFQPKT